MKKILLIICLLGSVIGWSQDFPKAPNPPRLVNDFANKLTPEEANQLEQKLVALDESTSNQIAIVIVNSLGGYDIQDYATKLFRDWGIGNKKTNNGVLILASIEDRKIRIEAGYGLEGAIPDITAGSIIRNTITPAFKKGKFYDGLNAATDDLAKAAAGEYKTPREKKGKGTSGGSILGFLIILFVVLMIVGNSGRGGGGGMVSRRGFGNVAETLLWTSLLGGGNRGGGGGWGGGDSGGFGGFGGGSSGGGGASGDW